MRTKGSFGEEMSITLIEMEKIWRVSLLGQGGGKTSVKEKGRFLDALVWKM